MGRFLGNGRIDVGRGERCATELNEFVRGEEGEMSREWEHGARGGGCRGVGG
jgi:hypothetical protein